jgi:hypothetical protein
MLQQIHNKLRKHMLKLRTVWTKRHTSPTPNNSFSQLPQIRYNEVYVPPCVVPACNGRCKGSSTARSQGP